MTAKEELKKSDPLEEKEGGLKNWVILLLIIVIAVFAIINLKDYFGATTIETPDESAEKISVVVTDEELGIEPETPAISEIDTSDISKTFTVSEGDLVNLNVKTNYEEGIIITYSPPLDSNGEWQTAKGDKGEYPVTITASDGSSEVAKKILVVVESTNSAPVLEPINEITVNEGETININPVASDPDKDPITILYSGWMTSSTYTTNLNDAGEYTVTVTVTDGSLEATQDIKIIVNNVELEITDITLD